METLFLLVPVVLVLLVFAVGALMWAIKSGQFDDLEGPAYRILHEDDDPRIPFNRPKEGEPDRGNKDESGEASGSGRDGAKPSDQSGP
mgnify:CR=1 FL=1